MIQDDHGGSKLCKAISVLCHYPLLGSVRVITPGGDQVKSILVAELQFPLTLDCNMAESCPEENQGRNTRVGRT